MDSRIDNVFKEEELCVSIVVGREEGKQIFYHLLEKGIHFVEIDKENYLKELWEEDIILITKNNYGNESEFFIESLLNSRGETLQVCSELCYVQKDLIDAIDLKQLEGEILVLQ